MESTLPPKVKLHVPSEETYAEIKEGIYGGRVVAKNGIYNEEILYADVVSLYPSAMRLLEHSYGEPKKVTTINWDKHGIYKVKLTHTQNTKPENCLEFVPRRINGKLSWSWFKEHIGTYHTYDLLIAKEEGYQIEIIEGIEYPHKGFIFNQFIDTLFSLKNKHSKCDCKEQPCPIRMIAKIGLNGGGYGKFVQKPIDKEVMLVKKDVVAGICEDLKTNKDNKIIVGNYLIDRPKFYNLDCEKYDKMVIESNGKPIYSTQCGISISSASRYRLYKLCRQFPNIKILYSDTVSIFVRKTSVNPINFKKACGTNLGDLDDSGVIIDKMLIGGPKMYAYCFGDKIKMYCKGVPNSLLSQKQFEYSLENKDNKIIYEFEVLRRKLTNIMTDNIEKEIKQTGILI